MNGVSWKRQTFLNPFGSEWNFCCILKLLFATYAGQALKFGVIQYLNKILI